MLIAEIGEVILTITSASPPHLQFLSLIIHPPPGDHSYRSIRLAPLTPTPSVDREFSMKTTCLGVTLQKRLNSEYTCSNPTGKALR